MSRWAHWIRSCGKKCSWSSSVCKLESGITFIIVTHDQEEALVMSDRMAVLDGGKVCQCSPSELYENPNSRFVANFIGVSKLFEGVRSGERSVRVNGQELVVGDPGRTPGAWSIGGPGGASWNVAALTEEGGTCANQVSGKIVEIAYQQASTPTCIKDGLSDKALIVRVPSSQFEFARFAIGTTIRLGWQPRHARVLTR